MSEFLIFIVLHEALPSPFGESFPIFYCFILLVKYIVSPSKSISITSLLKKNSGTRESPQSLKWVLGGKYVFLHFFNSRKAYSRRPNHYSGQTLSSGLVSVILATFSSISVFVTQSVHKWCLRYPFHHISFRSHDSFLQSATALKHGNDAIQTYPGAGKKVLDKGKLGKNNAYVSGIPKEAEEKGKADKWQGQKEQARIIQFTCVGQLLVVACAICLIPFWEPHVSLLLLPKCRTLTFMELTLSVTFRDS